MVPLLPLLLVPCMHGLSVIGARRWLRLAGGIIALRGAVVEMTHDGADEHIDVLANKYLGTDYPNRREGEQRVKVRIRPERVAMQPE